MDTLSTPISPQERGSVMLDWRLDGWRKDFLSCPTSPLRFGWAVSLHCRQKDFKGRVCPAFPFPFGTRRRLSIPLNEGISLTRATAWKEKSQLFSCPKEIHSGSGRSAWRCVNQISCPRLLSSLLRRVRSVPKKIRWARRPNQCDLHFSLNWICRVLIGLLLYWASPLSAWLPRRKVWVLVAVRPPFGHVYHFIKSVR